MKVKETFLNELDRLETPNKKMNMLNTFFIYYESGH